MTTLAKKKPRGAPSKRTPELRQAILEAVELGTPITHCAQAAGICFETLCSWRRDDPQFDAEIQNSISKGIQARLRIVHKAMESKDENVALRAATWWLCHAPNAARYFSESSRLELSGPDGESLGTDIVLLWPHQLAAQVESIHENITPDRIAETASVAG
jgi:transposase-like protein